MWSTFLETVPDHEWSMTKVVLEYNWSFCYKCLFLVPLVLLNFFKLIYIIYFLLHFILQIVNTLISKKENADKMLLYAENHNQVTHPFSICWRTVRFIFKVSLCMNLTFPYVAVSLYLEGGHLPKYCLVKLMSIRKTTRSLYWGDLHYIKYVAN
jgi:hypothetical protein